jgi:hypothetical protein
MWSAACGRSRGDEGGPGPQVDAEGGSSSNASGRGGSAAGVGGGGRRGEDATGGTGGRAAAGGSSGSGEAGETGEAGGLAGGGEAAGGAGPTFTCDEDVSITSLAELEAFDALGCIVLDGTLTIRSPTLTSLDALSGTLTRITEALMVEANPALTNIRGLAGLTRIDGSLVVMDDARLTDLTGLDELDRLGSDSGVDTLVITSNPELESVEALGGLSQMLVSVVVTENTALTSLRGIDKVRVANSVLVANNPFLTELDGLSALEQAGTITFASNPTFQTLELPALVASGSLVITGHEKLGAISVPGLAEVGDSLTIAGNSMLTSLGALDELASVGTLTITGNPMLPQCAVDALDARLQACNGGCMGNDASATCD